MTGEFFTFDNGKDRRRVEYNQFLQGLNKKSGTDANAELWKIFSVFDKNGNGKIDTEAEAMELFGFIKGMAGDDEILEQNELDTGLNSCEELNSVSKENIFTAMNHFIDELPQDADLEYDESGRIVRREKNGLVRNYVYHEAEGDKPAFVEVISGKYRYYVNEINNDGTFNKDVKVLQKILQKEVNGTEEEIVWHYATDSKPGYVERTVNGEDRYYYNELDYLGNPTPDTMLYKNEKNGVVTTFTYNDGCVEIRKAGNSDLLKVANVDMNGAFSDYDFISREYDDENGKKITIDKYTIEGMDLIAETEEITSDKSLKKIYGTLSYQEFELYKNLGLLGKDVQKQWLYNPETQEYMILENSIKELIEVYTEGDNEYVVYYDNNNGNTITFAKNGDSVSRLIKKFNFKDESEFYALNPHLKGKTLKVLDKIVVPGQLAANDDKIISQGSRYDAMLGYYNTQQQIEIKKFKDEHLKKLDDEVFNTLNNLEGLELNNENIGMYFTLNSLKPEVQKRITAQIEALAKEGKTPDEIKNYFLTDPNAVQLKTKNGGKEPLNLFNGFTIELQYFAGGFETETPMSAKAFVQDVMGLDPTKDEGKKYYDKLCNVADSNTAMDINAMFSNINERQSVEYKKWYDKEMARLNSAGYKNDNSVKATGEREYLKKYPPITKEQAQEMYKAVIDKMTAEKDEKVTTKYDDFINDNKDFYLRQFAATMVYSLHSDGAGELLGTAAMKDILNPSKYPLKAVGKFYQTKGKEIYETMMADCYKGNAKFAQSLKTYTWGLRQEGADFDPEKMKHCIDVLNNEESTEAQKTKALEDAFGYQIVHSAHDLVGVANFVDGATDMALMISGTGLIGKGLAKGAARLLPKATKAGRIITGATKGAKWGERLTQIGLSATNFVAWESGRYTVNYFTNDIEEDFSYGKGLKQSALGGAAFGTFAGAWGMGVTNNVIKWIFKNPETEVVAKNAMRTVQKQLANTTEFGSREVMSIYGNAQAKAMSSFGKEAVGFASETIGFSCYELGQKALNGELEINSAGDVLEVLGSQAKNLLSFKAMGRILFMHKAGKMPPNSIDISKKQDLKFERLTKDGRDVFKVTYPDGKTEMANSMAEVVALSNQHIENVTLFNPLEKLLQRDKTVDLGDGITLTKSEKGYTIRLKGGQEVVAKDLRSAFSQAQQEYTILGYEEQLQQKGKCKLANGTEVTYNAETKDYTMAVKDGQTISGKSLNELLLNKSLYDYVLSFEAAENTADEGKKSELVRQETVISESNIETQPTKADAKTKKEGVLEGGINPDDLTEIAPFARHLVESEQTLLAEKTVKELEQALQSKMLNKNSAEEQQLVQNIIDKVTSDNIDIVNTMLADKSISNELMLNILNSLKSSYKNNVFNIALMPIMVLQSSGIIGDIKVRDKLKSDYAQKLLLNENVPNENIPVILQYLEKGNSNLVDAALNKPNFDFNLLPAILKSTLTDDSIHVVANGMAYKVSDKKMKFAESLINNEEFPNNCIADAIRYYNSGYIDNKFVEELCNNPNYPPSQISSLIINIGTKRNGNWYLFNSQQTQFKQKLAKRLVSDKNCPNECVADIIGAIDSHQEKLFEKLYADENIPKEELANILNLEYGLKIGANKLNFLGKTMVLTNAVAIEDKTLVYLEKYGIDKNKVDALVDKISIELGMKKENIYTSEENKKLLFTNYVANNSNVEKTLEKIDLNKYKNGIPLKYSRAEFTKDIQNILDNLSAEDKTSVMNYFGFNFENGKMEGFPIIPEKSATVREELQPAIENIRGKIVEFTQNNETTINDPELKPLFDAVIKGCPEFATIIGKVQHGTHKYTVDIHTLKVLQNAINDPEYQKLDDESKTVLKFAILLHDVGKKEGVIDKEHYETSAKYAVSILEKYNLPARTKSRIIETIYNHHWFEQYNKNEISANTVNALFRTPQDLQLGMIMAKADLMGVSDDFHLKITKTHTIKDFNEFFDKKRDELLVQQDTRYKNANLVMDTKFQQTNKRKFPVQTVTIKGKPQEIPVLNLTDESLSDDLYEYGFAKGVTRKDARFFAHFNDRLKGLKVFMALSSSPTTESVQSLSMIALDNSRAYRNQIYGVITDVDMANIAQASNENIGSGYKKDLKNYTKDLYGFLQVNTTVRDCLINELEKSSIELTKDEYTQLAEKIVDIQYSTQITDDIKVGDKIIPAKVLQDALNASRDKLFDSSLHSEIVAINPRVKALVARVSSTEECSQEFLELAAENNLPIILIGHNEHALTSINTTRSEVPIEENLQPLNESPQISVIAKDNKTLSDKDISDLLNNITPRPHFGTKEEWETFKDIIKDYPSNAKQIIEEYVAPFTGLGFKKINETLKISVDSEGNLDLSMVRDQFDNILQKEEIRQQKRKELYNSVQAKLNIDDSDVIWSIVNSSMRTADGEINTDVIELAAKFNQKGLHPRHLEGLMDYLSDYDTGKTSPEIVKSFNKLADTDIETQKLLSICRQLSNNGAQEAQKTVDKILKIHTNNPQEFDDIYRLNSKFFETLSSKSIEATQYFIENKCDEKFIDDLKSNLASKGTIGLTDKCLINIAQRNLLNCEIKGTKINSKYDIWAIAQIPDKIYEEVINDPRYTYENIVDISRYHAVGDDAVKIFEATNKDFEPATVIKFLHSFNPNGRSVETVLKLANTFKGKLNHEEIIEIMGAQEVYNNNVDLVIKLFESCYGKLSNEQITSVFYSTNIFNLEGRIKVFQTLDGKLDYKQIHEILGFTTTDTDAEAKIKLFEIINNELTPEQISDVLNSTEMFNVDSRIKIFQALNGKLPAENVVDIAKNTHSLIADNQIEIFQLLNKKLTPNQITDVIIRVKSGNSQEILDLCKNYEHYELTPETLLQTIDMVEKHQISVKQINKLYRTMGKEKALKLSEKDFTIACKLNCLYNKQNINEIPMSEKRELLRNLVANNTGMFDVSDDLRKEFPLIPKNKEEYCSLLPSLVRSLGIDTKELTPEQRITMFNSSMTNMATALKQLSDTDFAQMTITQEYPKDQFIQDVLTKVKDLSSSERQKVYDYFGFELHHNKGNKTGFSITGYPINLNNGKKLAQIEEPKTKAVVEALRPDVMRFSENNKVECSNPQIETLLNEVIDCLPELRTEIGREQHGTHDFDVMQHSLKVMQKVAQDPKFATLNESDQKIMLLASLMHDITKSEGRRDITHATESCFDSFFIAQKFHLTKEEEIKLHTLIKQHEWLEYVNTARSEEELTKRLQSVAYDLQQSNLFDMAEIFTHADLRAVKVDDSFHDRTDGKARICFDGTVRSFGESANVYAQRIRGYIAELQKSQPLLPQTKFPKATRINKVITQVNPDGSTNIKGVYKDKDGLVIIKFNEVEDWEAIGFPKGSVSTGIMAGDDINTGNIKFFVHGLVYSNQLAKFDAFSLVDSDALLSVSYAERPESKYRFFRPQGVILDVNSKYVHGGGESDAGSGCGKNINEFKNRYIFGGEREKDRLYVSDLIKKATGMSDDEYVKFFDTYKDKNFTEIEPEEVRNQILQAFATINSRTRNGGRAYNEMYISNPNDVMGVFAYSMDYNEKIVNPVEFLNRSTIGKYEKGFGSVGDISAKDRTDFLRQYALERDLPFIILGD